MLYIATLTSKTHGNVINKFGNYDEMLRCADVNNERFNTEVRPAHQDDISNEITSLEGDLASARTDYDNSPWGAGSRHRKTISEIVLQIGAIRPFIREEGSRGAVTS